MTRLFAGTQFDIPPRCDDCGELEDACRCDPNVKRAAEAQRAKEALLVPPEKQLARLQMENRKGGRKVTVIRGLTHTANDFPHLLSKLKAACGSGGTANESLDVLELQGNQLAAATRVLRELGYKVK